MDKIYRGYLINNEGKLVPFCSADNRNECLDQLLRYIKDWKLFRCVPIVRCESMDGIIEYTKTGPRFI